MKVERRLRRILRKKVVKGSNLVPRCCIFESSRHFYVQLIDDSKGVTLFSTSTLQVKLSKNRENILSLTEKIINFMHENGLERLIFHKNGFLFQNTVREFAARLLEAGLLRKSNLK